jgi:hypothetical protein
MTIPINFILIQYKRYCIKLIFNVVYSRLRFFLKIFMLEKKDYTSYSMNFGYFLELA